MFDESNYDAGRKREDRREAAEIYDPPISDEQRRIGAELRELCRNDLREFNVRVFPNSTGLKPFGPVQLDSIAQDQSVILQGGKVCKAEPRGYGKTTRTKNASLWATLYGYRHLVPVFSSNITKSKTQIIAGWKGELISNDLLLWMFPDLVWPLRALENKPQRCPSQLYRGKLTHTAWTADRIVFPHVEGEPGSGSVLVALPLKSCRGVNHTTPDGVVLRPDLVLFDDVQTDEDAANPSTVKKIEDLIDHSAMMLGGHSVSMSAIMSCTVRCEGDLAETYLKKPGWRRVRYKMLDAPAEAQESFWFGQYAEARAAYNPEDPDDQRRAHVECLALYEASRELADKGAKVTWDWAYAWGDAEPVEVSAIQHAYNIRIDLGESVFASECQNEPLPEQANLAILTAPEIQKKQHGYKRGEIPAACDVVTSFIDVQGSLLYWLTAAWQPDFTGYLIDYGAWPEQGREYFTLRDARKTLRRKYKGTDDEGAAFQGVQDCIAFLCDREYRRRDGATLRMRRLLVDCNGQISEKLNEACRQSKYAPILTPSYGRGITATQKPISQWQQSRGKRCGPEWVPTEAKGKHLVGVIVDVNYWKKRFHDALALPIGSRGSISLFEAKAQTHRMLAEQLASEKPTLVESNGRSALEWGLRSGHDNHLFDCAVGSMVGASLCGVTNSVRVPKKKPKRRIVA